MITADGDDAGIFDLQPCIRTRNDAELTAESPSYSTPADSSAEGRSDLCEQLIKSREIRSCSPVSLDPSSGPVLTAATDLGSPSSTPVTDAALTEAMSDEPSHATGVDGHLGLLTRVDRFEQARWKDCKRTPPNAWTSDQDKQLLHVRDIAQLNWKNIVNYFPGMTPDAIKVRYKHLNGSKMTFETLANETNQRAQMRKRRSYLTTSTSPRVAKKCRASSRTESRKQSISIMPEYHATPHCGRVTKRAKPTKYMVSLAAATREVECQRPSLSPSMLI